MKTVMGRIAVVGAIGLLVVSVALAADAYLSSGYGSATVATPPGATSFTVTYTNTTGSRVGIGSIMARSDRATNTWSILVVNNSQTNILKTGSLTPVSYTLLYDGYGNVPLGAGGVVIISGSVDSNAATASVQWQVNVLNK